MKPSSCKAKGRRFQQFIRDELRAVCKAYGMAEDGDIESRGMGQQGEDIIISPRARQFINYYIEAKNVENLNVHKVFTEHYEKYKSKGLALLVHTKNRSVPLVTLTWEDFKKYVNDDVLQELKKQ